MLNSLWTTLEFMLNEHQEALWKHALIQMARLSQFMLPNRYLNIIRTDKINKYLSNAK